MDIERFREECLMLPYAEESLPFGDDLLVFKVKGRIFAILPLDEDEPSVSLKCDPDRCEELRAHYDAVIPGYHLNKRHWNTLYLERDLSTEQIIALLHHSYALVIAKLPKALRQELQDQIPFTQY